MQITVTASGISLDGPLVAGEKVAVTVSGFDIAAEDKPTMSLRARFPDALLSSVELAEDENTPGTWTGQLDTATKQTAVFFATARADERRDAVLELVAGRASLARITVPMANSVLCPTPDNAPDASPVYIPVPGAQGEPGPLRGRQYSYAVRDGDIIELPADATSVVLSASAYAEITITPPSVAGGADWSFWILGATGTSGITANIVGDTGSAPQINQYGVAVAMKRGSGAFSFVFS